MRVTKYMGYNYCGDGQLAGLFRGGGGGKGGNSPPLKVALPPEMGYDQTYYISKSHPPQF